MLYVQKDSDAIHKYRFKSILYVSENLIFVKYNDVFEGRRRESLSGNIVHKKLHVSKSDDV